MNSDRGRQKTKLRESHGFRVPEKREKRGLKRPKIVARSRSAIQQESEVHKRKKKKSGETKDPYVQARAKMFRGRAEETREAAAPKRAKPVKPKKRKVPQDAALKERQREHTTKGPREIRRPKGGNLTGPMRSTALESTKAPANRILQLTKQKRKPMPSRNEGTSRRRLTLR